MTTWRCALELDSRRNATSGSAADLRIYTEFLHNEHIDVGSSNAERIREVAEFGVTYRIDNRWTAGIMSLRQPIELPRRGRAFGLAECMSKARLRHHSIGFPRPGCAQ